MSIDRSTWITKNTEGYSIVVEFGAFLFETLALCSCPNKIGIEGYEPYLAKALYNDCVKVVGDFRNFDQLINVKSMIRPAVALFVCSLEHITMDEAADLMKRVQTNFDKVLLSIPEGSHPQSHDGSGLGGDTWQTHRSSWQVDDVKRLGFTNVEVDPTFHNDPGKDPGCIFAIWERP